MKIPPFCATRAFKATLAGGLTATAVTATLLLSQTGVTGTEKQPSDSFTVAGDGELPTKRPDLGDSRDPLSTNETGYAIHLASTATSIPDDATDVRGESGPEFLYADLPDDVDGTGRKALVVLYDYTGNKTYHQLVNLKTGDVTSKSAQRLQPPPSPDEAKTATTIAINADPALPFSTQFAESEGVPLISSEQVGYVAGAWTFDGTTVRGKSCGTDRCVQLMVKTTSGIYLSTLDFVVNLSTGDVISLEKS
ncbi:hypothetical protein [Aeromicrobium sp. UC242_57]|uniref:hypothetical protein n=1 Tax=Aeromicrobium sp. UC242_57 TaxID=3374624 RepID=UPI00378F34F3